MGGVVVCAPQPSFSWRHGLWRTEDRIRAASHRAREDLRRGIGNARGAEKALAERGHQQAPGARRCVFGRLVNRQNATSWTRIVRSLNDQRVVTTKGLALGPRPA